MSDTFRGDNAHLVSCIEALLEMDADGILRPHGVGGHARGLLSAAAARLAPTQGADAQPVAYVPRAHSDSQHTIVGEFGWAEISEKPFECSYPEIWECCTLYAAPVIPSTGNTAKYVAIYQINEGCVRTGDLWRDVAEGSYGPLRARGYQGRIVYATRDAAPSDAAVTALKFIKVLVCGDSSPRWTNAHQTTISRRMIADIIDKAIAASAPSEPK